MRYEELVHLMDGCIYVYGCTYLYALYQKKINHCPGKISALNVDYIKI